MSKGFEIDGVNNKEEEINEEILKLDAHAITRSYYLKEDMYSMLFVASVRPEYILYCEMKLDVENKNQTKPHENSIKVNASGLTYFQKLNSILCCKSVRSIEVADDKTL